MSGTPTLERARRTIGRLSEEGMRWPAVAGEMITRLRRVVGFDAFCAAQNDPRVPMPAAALADNDAVSSRQRRFWQIETQVPDVNKVSHLVRAPCPVGVLSAATGGDLARSARWEELLGPGGIGDELRAALVADGRWWFTTDDAAALAGLVGPMAAVARRAWTADPAGRAGVDEVPGTVVVTADGRQVSATPAAERWLGRLDPAQRASGTLIYAMAARLAAVGAPYGPAESVRGLARGTDGSWIELDASRLGVPLGAGAIAITVQAARPEAVTELLVQAYALTGRERQVADLVLAGRSTAEIGAELFLSRHTVADHLKAIFAKTGVHTRAELARRLTGRSR